jgi:hypothetical protein
VDLCIFSEIVETQNGIAPKFGTSSQLSVIVADPEDEA